MAASRTIFGGNGMKPDVAGLSFEIDVLHAAYEKGVSAQAIINEVYRRIAAVSDPGIFIHLRDETAVTEEASALPPFDPETYPLWGVPFAIKDNIDLAGTPTTAACPAYAYDPAQDSFAVAQLKLAGGIPIGKTNLDQFATGLVGIRSPYPAPKNAIDPELVPGGSSAGSAVCVAHGLVSFALGTDTAGSGRVPAALNNIVGLKPTLGALSNSGVVPACRTLDTISIFALTVSDAWTVFNAAAGYDADDAYSRNLDIPPVTAPPRATRIGVPNAATREFFGDTVQADCFNTALRELNDAGGNIIELDFTPFYEVAELLYEGAWLAERLSVIDDLFFDNPEALHPVTRQIIGRARKLTAVDAFRGMYRLAELKRKTEPLLQQVDVLCVPTIPTFYCVADLEFDPIEPNARLGIYTNFVNLMDMCGIAVPCSPRDDGLPGSITLLAPAGRDSLTAAIAENLQRNGTTTLGSTGIRPSFTKSAKSGLLAGEVEIAVVGAHMSGLPLNHELISFGGRFLFEGQTAENYRLFALQGGPPMRPGMIKVDNGESISLEVWALPIQGFGAFVASIPQPLVIGTINLENGSKVKGFLCEQADTHGARDITKFGGWRNYLAK